MTLMAHEDMSDLEEDLLFNVDEDLEAVWDNSAEGLVFPSKLEEQKKNPCFLSDKINLNNSIKVPK